MIDYLVETVEDDFNEKAWLELGLDNFFDDDVVSDCKKSISTIHSALDTLEQEYQAFRPFVYWGSNLSLPINLMGSIALSSFLFLILKPFNFADARGVSLLVFFIMATMSLVTLTIDENEGKESKWQKTKRYQELQKIIDEAEDNLDRHQDALFSSVILNQYLQRVGEIEAKYLRLYSYDFMVQCYQNKKTNFLKLKKKLTKSYKKRDTYSFLLQIEKIDNLETQIIQLAKKIKKSDSGSPDISKLNKNFVNNFMKETL